MAQTFYPFVGEGANDPKDFPDMVENPARIAVFDDLSAAPRVVVVQPADVRSYLEEVTATVTRLAKEQGGRISFTVIREVVENYVHAYFKEPTISILNGGNTIRFSDQGPGIREKDKALEYGTTSATDQMKRYIRGVGSGLPYAQQYLRDHGGDLTIEDNISAGTIVTLTLPADTTTGLATTGTGDVAAAQGGLGSSGLAAQQPQTPAMQQAGADTWGAPVAQPIQQPAPLPQAYGAPVQATPATTPMPAGYGALTQPTAINTGYVATRQGLMPVQATQAPQACWPQQAQVSSPQQIPPSPPGWPQYPTVQAPAQPQQASTAGSYPYQGTLATPAPANAPGATLVPAQPQTWAADISVSERGRAAVAYLLDHESVGPTELTQLYGSSMSTWTRELKRLEDQGLLRHVGQKRFLTDLGKMFATSLRQG